MTENEVSIGLSIQKLEPESQSRQTNAIEHITMPPCRQRVLTSSALE